MSKFLKATSRQYSYKYLSLLIILVWGLSGCDIAGVSDLEENSSGKRTIPIPNQAPYASNPNSTWYKGNLHAHSYWGDGDDYPEMILNWYKEQGYNFGVISGHNTIQQGKKWIEFNKGTQDEATFKQYRNKFGESWVEYEDLGDRIRVRLKTFDEYSQKVSVPGSFLPINSEEIDYRDGSRLLHVNATNVQEVIQPQPGGSTVEILQRTIDEVKQQSSRLNVPMMAQINHPNINYSVSASDLKQLEGARFFEVYNGHPNARNSGGGGQPGTEEVWDEVNTQYILDGKKLLYGLATDDSHRYDTYYNGPGRGWVQVRSTELSRAALIAAMREGNFYASTGVRLAGIQFDGSTLHVEVDAEAGVNYTVKFIGTRNDQPENTGVVLAEEQGTQASYTFKENDMYVRAKIVSDKPKENAYKDGEVEVAWVQPVKNENAKAPSSPPPSTSDNIVYEESLSSPWVNASWGSTIDYNSTEQVKTGSKSIKVQQDKWGALSVHSGNWGAPEDVDPTKYETVEFAIYADAQSSKISIMLENDNGDSFPRVSYGTVAADRWTQVQIPMSELNPNNQLIHRLDVFETSGSSKTYFIDDLKFSGSGGSSTPPPEAPSLISPDDGATGISASPTLSWDGSTSQYHLKVAEDSTWQTVVADKPGLTSTSYTVSNLAAGTTYYWKVNGTDQSGSTSAWSATRKFTTKKDSSGSGSAISTDIYLDNLESPWINASWSSTVDYGNTGQVYSGSRSIKVQQGKWGALSVHSGNWGAPEDVDPTKYETVEFAIYADAQSSKISIMLENDNGDSFPRVSYGTVAADRWTQVQIPMSELNPNKQVIHRLDILETSGNNKTYYVDAVRFIEK